MRPVAVRLQECISLNMVRAHFWGAPEWASRFADELAAVADCRFGEVVDEDTQILVKGRPDAEEVARLKGLIAIVVPFAGIPVQTRQLLGKFPSIALFNLHHNAADTAEMAISLYLAAAKNIVVRDRNLRTGQWSEGSFMRGGTGESLRAAGKRALVLGYGSIGQRIARVCEALEMDVIAIRRNGPFDDRVRPLGELDQILPGTDALFAALPLTPETEGLIDARRLALLPKSAVISNIARGAIFDELALYEALKENRIAAAGIDVWWNYPNANEPCLPSSLPFHELDNVVMTPHVGGASDASEEHRWRALADLVRRIVDGSAKPASVELGY